MHVWVEECDICGFVAQDTARASAATKKALGSAANRALWQRNIDSATEYTVDGPVKVRKRREKMPILKVRGYWPLPVGSAAGAKVYLRWMQISFVGR